MTTHEQYTPDELISLATDDLRMADRLEADQVADPTTVSRIMVAHASAQTCALIAIARLLHELVHKHPAEASSYEQALKMAADAGFFDPSQARPTHLDGPPPFNATVDGEVPDLPLTTAEIRRLRAFLNDGFASPG